MSERSLSYEVSFDPSRHLIHVRLNIQGALPEPLVLQMPCWTPGSYLVREYARHVENLRAHADPKNIAKKCAVRKLTKDSWSVAHGGESSIVVEYSVYAHDLTVRTNHVSESHAYFNGAATFVRPVQDGVAWDAVSPRLIIEKPVSTWTIATGMKAVAGLENTFEARDFDDLCDCPVDVGVHERLEFTVQNKPHAFVIWGANARFDRSKLIQDVRSIVETEATLFGGLPYDNYLFLLHLAPGMRGGLEHENSTTLLASPDSFETESGYDDLLSLIAHEFFHLWQVKRTRPSGLRPYRYERENYTRMLWLFEGGTSYYDWMLIRRSGLVSPKRYLEHLASEIARLEETPGRFSQTVEEASFDAWIKLYRPDEHSVNSTVSYYLKGEIVCAMIDLAIRSRSNGTKSFDDVLRYLWAEYGQKQLGVDEDNPEAVFAAATGVDVSDVIDHLVRSKKPIAYDEYLSKFALAVKTKGAKGAALGVRLRSENGRAVLASVLRDSAAENAGLAPGDEIIAIDGRRVDDSSLRRRLEARKPGETVELLYARRELIASTKAVLAEPAPDGYEIVPVTSAPESARTLGASWLGPNAAAMFALEGTGAKA